MKKIDLHQDLILSYKHDSNSFFSHNSQYQDVWWTDAWNFWDYLGAELSFVFWVTRPYTMSTLWANWPLAYDQWLLQESIDWYKQLANLSQDVAIIYSSKDILNTKKLTLLLHIEWFDGCTTLSDIEKVYTLWIRSLWFVWNFDNTLSYCNKWSEGWLTRLWKDAVSYMNELWMIIDTAHMNHQAMMDVLEISKKPIINSHSNLRIFCDHSRNVYDEFLLLLAKNWWVLWLSMCSDFIAWDGNEATIDQYVEQIRYIRNIVGDDHIAFWSDYHWILQWKETIKDFWKIRKMPILQEVLLENFWTQFTEKFFYINALRVIEDNL